MNINLVEDDGFIRGTLTGEYDTKGNWIDSISAHDAANTEYEDDPNNKFNTPICFVFRMVFRRPGLRISALNRGCSQLYLEN